MILLSLILAAIMLYTEFRLTSSFMRFTSNGFGALPLVLQNKADAPAQYRVLIPWMYFIMPFPPGRTLYVLLKYIGMVFGLVAFGTFAYTVGVPWQFSIPLMAAILPMMFMYDYADCYYELGFFCLAWSMGQQHLVALGIITFLATLNRETGVFIPVGYWALTGDITGAIILLVASGLGGMIPRLIYGMKPRYCMPGETKPITFCQFKANIKDLRKALAIEHIWTLLLLVTYAIVGLIAKPYGGMGRLYLVMGAFGVLMLVPTKWCESRVFMPMLGTLIPMFWYI